MWVNHGQHTGMPPPIDPGAKRATNNTQPSDSAYSLGHRAWRWAPCGRTETLASRQTRRLESSRKPSPANAKRALGCAAAVSSLHRKQQQAGDQIAALAGHVRQLVLVSNYVSACRAAKSIANPSGAVSRASGCSFGQPRTSWQGTPCQLPQPNRHKCRASGLIHPLSGLR